MEGSRGQRDIQSIAGDFGVDRSMSDSNLLIKPLPTGWNNHQFGEVCERVKDTYMPVEGGTTPYVGLEHLAQGFPAFVGCGIENDVKSSKTAFKIGDILFGKLRPYLRKGAQADFDGISSTDILVFRANGRCESRFLKYLIYCDEFINHAKSTTSGVQHPRTSWSSLKAFHLSLPPLREQKKIAYILSTVQRAIEAQQRNIQITTELKKALMHKLFTEGLRNEPQKQTEIGPVPESWEVVPLSKVIRSKLQNGAFVKKPETGHGYLFANVVDMYRESHLDLSRLERISIHPNSVSQYWLEDGDILVVRSSLKRDGIGQSCVARNLVESVFYDCHLIRVQLEKTKLIPEFLSAFWRSDIGKNDLILRSKTTTMTTINQQGISKALVPIASIAEQAEIIEALEIVDTKIRVHRRQQDSSKNLFRSLVHELMTAKTRVHKASFFGQAINS